MCVINKQKKATRRAQDPLLSMGIFAVCFSITSGSSVPNPQARKDRVELLPGSFMGSATSPSGSLTAVHFQKASAVDVCCSVCALSSGASSIFASLVLIRL